MVEVAANPPEGTPTWVDLGIPDLARAEEFYGPLFGWEFVHGPPEAGGYTMCQLRGERVAALRQVPSDAAASFWWNLYLAVDDCDGVVARASAAGAKVVVPPDDVTTAGRMAILVDPVGAQLGLWQGREHTGARIVNEPGSLVWNELITPIADRGAATVFYSSVFGYVLEELPDPEMQFTVLRRRSDSRPMAGVGGTAGSGVAEWRSYFEVADVDATVARATESGGRCTSDPEDTPWGRIAGLRDPFGAEFYVMTSAAS